MVVFTRKNKIVIGVFSFLLILWIYLFNGIPYFSYKSVLEINKSTNRVELKMFPSNKTLELCSYDDLVNVENNYDFMCSFLSSSQYKGVKPQTKLTLVTANKKINIYPHIKGYEADSKIEEIKIFKMSEDNIYKTTFVDFGKWKTFFILIIVIYMFCFSDKNLINHDINKPKS